MRVGSGKFRPEPLGHLALQVVRGTDAEQDLDRGIVEVEKGAEVLVGPGLSLQSGFRRLTGAQRRCATAPPLPTDAVAGRQYPHSRRQPHPRHRRLKTARLRVIAALRGPSLA
jgi:hypothetical protein